MLKSFDLKLKTLIDLPCFISEPNEFYIKGLLPVYVIDFCKFDVRKKKQINFF